MGKLFGIINNLFLKLSICSVMISTWTHGWFLILFNVTIVICLDVVCPRFDH